MATTPAARAGLQSPRNSPRVESEPLPVRNARPERTAETTPSTTSVRSHSAPAREPMVSRCATALRMGGLEPSSTASLSWRNATNRSAYGIHVTGRRRARATMNHALRNPAFVTSRSGLTAPLIHRNPITEM